MTEKFDRGKKAPRNLRLKRGAGIGGTAILTLSMLSAGVLLVVMLVLVLMALLTELAEI